MAVKAREMVKTVTSNALRRVALWSPQSSFEDADIIYSTDGFKLELERLRKGAAWLVLGRKGIGKSALAHKFMASYKAEILSRKNEFDPALLHSRLKFFDKVFSAENAAQAFKLDILLLGANELSFHSNDQQLKKAAASIAAYYDKKWRRIAVGAFSLRNLIAIGLSYILPESVLDKLLSSSPLFRDPAAVETATRRTVDSLRSLYRSIAQPKPIYIIFDEIDLKLTQQKNSPLLREYLDALKGLLLACSSFDDIRQLGIPIYPIIILRNDIFSKIEAADHNKWQASAARVIYKEQEIREILRHRLATELVKSGSATGALDQTFDQVWSTYVDVAKTLQPSNKTMIRGVLERSFLRPRDAVYFLKLLATAAVKRPGAAKITPTDFLNSRAEYSRYFLGELKDELGYLYPFSDRIDEVLLDIFYPPVGGKVTLRNLANPDTVRAEFARFKAAVKSVGQTFEVEDLINDLIERSVLGVQVQTTSGPREFYEYSSDKAYRLREADAVCLHNAISDYFLDRVKA